MALDTPKVLDKVIVVVVDIIPTASMFRTFGNTLNGLRAYHWLLLAQASPFPETMISSTDGGRYFLEHTLASCTAPKTLQDFSEMALEEYRAAYCNPEWIHSTCGDYRAAAYIDRLHDDDDLRNSNKIALPFLAVWGKRGLFAEGMEGLQQDPLVEWQKYAPNAKGVSLDCGRFITEEDHTALVAATLDFL